MSSEVQQPDAEQDYIQQLLAGIQALHKHLITHRGN